MAWPRIVWTALTSALAATSTDAAVWHVLGYIDFGDLADIIVANWTAFEDLIPSQHWLRQRMDEREKARNSIAHNRM